jgi:hypothetical protein
VDRRAVAQDDVDLTVGGIEVIGDRHMLKLGAGGGLCIGETCERSCG